MSWFRNRCKWWDGPNNQCPLPRVAFFKAYPWHSTILQPIASKLFMDADLLIVSSGGELKKYRPQIIVVADAGVIPFLRKRLPQAIYIHVCHGLISKNQCSSYLHADYICVSSPYIAQRLEAMGLAPRKEFWATGLPAMDLISHSLRAPLKRSSSPTLIYAPTWNPSLSSAEIYAEELITYIRGSETNWTLLIKPHPHSYKATPEWITLWKRLSQDNPHVVLLDHSSDLASYAPLADVMISDTSSAPFLFLALNRPILLLRNPKSSLDGHAYDPQGIEWAWSDMAQEVMTPQEVYPKLTELFLGNDTKRAAREQYRDKLFGANLDGECSQRIASNILKLALVT